MGIKYVLIFLLCYLSCTEIGDIADANKLSQLEIYLKQAESMQDSILIESLFKKPKNLRELAQIIKSNSKVSTSEYNEYNESIEIAYINGLKGFIIPKTFSEYYRTIETSVTCSQNKNSRKAAIIFPFYNLASSEIIESFNQAKYALNDIYDLTVIVEINETIEVYKRFNDFKVVYIMSRCLVDRLNSIYFQTSIKEKKADLPLNEKSLYFPVYSEINEKDLLKPDFFQKLDVQSHRSTYLISENFFIQGNGRDWFDSALVVLNTSESMKTISAEKLFSNCEVLGLCGWSTSVEAEFIDRFNEEVLKSLLNGQSGIVFKQFSEKISDFKYKIYPPFVPETYYLLKKSEPPTEFIGIGGEYLITFTWKSSAPSHNLYMSSSPGVTLNSRKIADVNSPYIFKYINNITSYFAITAVKNEAESNLSNEIEVTIDTTTGLIAFWFFDEGAGNTINDVCGNYYGKVTGTIPEWVDGVEGKALKLNGIDNCVSMPSSITLSEDFTISYNIYFEKIGNSPLYVMTKHKTDDNYDGGWSISMNFSDIGSANHFYFVNTSDGPNNFKEIIVKPINYQLNKWHEVKLSYNKLIKEYSFYLDKKLLKRDTITFDIKSNKHPFYIGAAYNGSPLAFSKFIIDEVRIYNKVK